MGAVVGGAGFDKSPDLILTEDVTGVNAGIKILFIIIIIVIVITKHSANVKKLYL